MKSFITFIMLVSLLSQSYSQNTTTYFNYFTDRNSDFTEARSFTNKNILRKTDSIFASLIIENWKNVVLSKNNPDDTTTEFDAAPVFNKKQIRKINEVPVNIDRIDKRNDIFELPQIYPVKQDKLQAKPDKIKFYGKEILFFYDRNFITQIGNSVNKNSIKEFYTAMTGTGYFELISQLRNEAMLMNLPDWGYFQLTYKVSMQICGNNKNSATILTWFLLQKTGYNVKIGLDRGTVVLLIGSMDKIFDKYFFKSEEVFFYTTENVSESIEILDAMNINGGRLFTFIIDKPINLPINSSEVKKQLMAKGSNHVVSIELNKNVIEFYNDYPKCNYDVYLNSAASLVVKESLMTALAPFIDKKSEINTVNLLLNFVQQNLKYKNISTANTNCKFVDQVFLSDNCNSLDYCVLYNYLVRQFLNLPVVGLKFPNSFASAIAFSSDVDGYFVKIKNKKYCIVEPVYQNSMVGNVIPQNSNQKATVYVSQHQLDNLLIAQVWRKISKDGLHQYTPHNSGVVDNDGNIYVTGFFKDTVKNNELNIIAPGKGFDAFVMKLDVQNKIKWIKTFGGNGNDEGLYVAVNEDNSIYFAGIFEDTLMVGNTQIDNLGYPDIFYAKLTSEGKVEEADKLNFDKVVCENKFIFSAFVKNGIEEKYLIDENELFANYGLFVDENENIIISGVLDERVSLLESFNKNRNLEAAHFGLPGSWKDEKSKLESQKYDKSIAGFFAFVSILKDDGSYVSGSKSVEILNKYLPEIQRNNPDIYKNVKKIKSLQNQSGIITVKTVDQSDLKIASLVIKSNAKIKITIYKGGNAQITVLSGVDYGQGVLTFDVNYIKLFKNSGDMLFDYDTDHSQKNINLQKDVLNKK